MSEDNADAAGDILSSCASCGIAESDDVKLKYCTACYLVKYCSIICQKDHRKQHKRGCKKRAAELRDELLFKQPESTHLGDCPICCLPLPLGSKKSSMAPCCSKIICKGCRYANMKREEEMRLKQTCPFCREPLPGTDEETDKLRMKRVEVNDPDAMVHEGAVQCGKKNYTKAVEYWTKAAALGSADAHCKLGAMYHDGEGVEKDKGKQIHHAEEAAIGGHARARYLLGCEEFENDNTERAVKHYIIAATQGLDEATEMLMLIFKMGLVEKDVVAATLRDHQAAVDATKSPQREAAEQYYQC